VSFLQQRGRHKKKGKGSKKAEKEARRRLLRTGRKKKQAVVLMQREAKERRTCKTHGKRGERGKGMVLNYSTKEKKKKKPLPILSGEPGKKKREDSPLFNIRKRKGEGKKGKESKTSKK